MCREIPLFEGLIKKMKLSSEKVDSALMRYGIFSGLFHINSKLTSESLGGRLTNKEA